MLTVNMVESQATGIETTKAAQPQSSPHTQQTSKYMYKSNSEWDGNNLELFKRKIASTELSDIQQKQANQLLTYKEQSSGEPENLKRIGIESQCDPLMVYYDGVKKTLIKGQILARTSEEISGFPVMALTAEVTGLSEKSKVYCPELITAPMTSECAAKHRINESLYSAMESMSSLSGKHKLESVVSECNRRKLSESQPLKFGANGEAIPFRDFSKIPSSSLIHMEYNKKKYSKLLRRQFGFFDSSDPNLKKGWKSQVNLAIPFKNLKNLPLLLKPEFQNSISPGKMLEILVKSTYISDLLSDFQTSDCLSAWMKHFLYVCALYSGSIESYFQTEKKHAEFLNIKSIENNIKYSHHQLMMEILDDYDLDLLSKKLLCSEKKRADLGKAVLDTCNGFHRSGMSGEAHKVYGNWIRGYLSDLSSIMAIRNQFGRNVVLGANTGTPYFLANGSKHYLPNQAATALSNWLPIEQFYKSVLPICIDNQGSPWTVLERRQCPEVQQIVDGQPKFPFTYQSKWYSEPTETEKGLMELCWGEPKTETIQETGALCPEVLQIMKMLEINQPDIASLFED